MTAAADALDHVNSTVGYLRATAGASERDDWIRSRALVADPEFLFGLATTLGERRGASQADVAVSIFVQGYAFRVAGAAIGAWVLDDVVLDVGAEGTSVAIGRDRPNELHLDEACLVEGENSLTTLHEVLIAGHLAPFVDNARAAMATDGSRIGAALLWSNIAASCAAAFGALMGPRPDLHATIRDRFELFLAAARPELARAGRLVPVGTSWLWERSACCLWDRSAHGARCEDCSLWNDDERRARYERVLEASRPAT